MKGFTEVVNKNISKHSRAGILSHFRNGSLFKANEMKFQDCIIIDIFYDDVEISNPLGSKTSKHKLAQFYFSISDFPDYLNSTTRNCFLLASLKSNDLKICGPNVIMQCIVNELTVLYEQGITFFDQDLGEHKTYKIALGKIREDNLGQHSGIGFPEGFTATYPCIMCSINKSVMRTATSGHYELLRTETQFLVDAAEGNLKKTGVKFLTCLQNLPYVSAIQLPTFDIMHDLFEGVIPDVVCFLLDSFINRKKNFTLDKLNHRIEAFNYGLHYGKSKPREIKAQAITGKSGFGLTSSQTITLTIFFPFLIADLISKESREWNLFILLRCIVDIVMNSELSVSKVGKLQFLVQEFLIEYLDVTKKHLKPKFHHMTQYASAILGDGPLKRFWSMPFETNHKFFKKYMQISCNFMNVPKTTAQKYQLQKCFQLLAHPEFKIQNVKTENSENDE